MKKLTIILFIVFTSVFGFSQENDTINNLSLSDALSVGLKNNYQIRLSDKDVEIAENNNAIGKAGMLPNVSVGAQQGNRFDNSENTLTGGRDDITTISVSPYVNAQWMIFNGFSARITKRNFEKFLEMSKGNMQLTLENTIADIINAYYMVVLEKEKLKVTNQLMQLSKDRYDYVTVRQELGTAVTYDVLQVKNAFLSDSSNFLLQKINYDNSGRELNRVLGDTSYTTYTPTDSLAERTDIYELNDLQTQMLDKNSSLNTLKINQSILENNIRLAKSSMYPSLSLNTGSDYSSRRVKYNDLSASNSYSWDLYANLSLSYTIFNGGNRKRNVANAKIEADKGSLQTEDLEITLQNTLYSLYEMYNIRIQLLTVARENLATAKLNLEISKDKFNAGSINSFNYRDVQIMYLNSAFSELQAKYNLIITHNDLMKISGNLVVSEE